MWICRSSNLANVLGLAGIKLPSFLAAHTVPCFVFVVKLVLITCQCFGFCRTILAQYQDFYSFPLPCPKLSRLGAWVWEGTQPWQLALTYQRDIPCHMVLCSAMKTREGGGRGNVCGYGICLSKQLLMCTEALLSRKLLDICLLMESSELTGLFLSSHTQLFLPLLNCHCLDPLVCLPSFYFLPIPQDGNEWEAGWVFGCQSESIHHSSKVPEVKFNIV